HCQFLLGSLRLRLVLLGCLGRIIGRVVAKPQSGEYRIKLGLGVGQVLVVGLGPVFPLACLGLPVGVRGLVRVLRSGLVGLVGCLLLGLLGLLGGSILGLFGHDVSPVRVPCCSLCRAAWDDQGM